MITLANAKRGEHPPLLDINQRETAGTGEDEPEDAPDRRNTVAPG
jgi:hypothetical protein